ncbi:MAG: hypothetical protein R2881_07105 [Eubacteriales bacterium]
MKVGTVVPEGLQAKHVSGGLTAHIQVEGANIAEILESAFLLITEAIEKTGKRIDLEHFYWCEVYTQERFCEPMSRGENNNRLYPLPVLPD